VGERSRPLEDVAVSGVTKDVEITRCEVCGTRELFPVLDLGKQPLCDDLIPVGSSRHCEVFPIDILYCKQCRTAHQRFQVPKVTLFPETYHYRSRFTGDVLAGMADLVASVETRLGSLADRTVLDVGCNDGSLLDKFAARGAKTVGVEPTGAYEDALGRGHAVFNDFFSEDFARTIRQQHPRVDVVTFTNVFAHIEDLPALLRALALVMGEDTLLVVENHYLGAVLAKNQFDTFYHEHPRTYSLTSFEHVARSLGRAVTTVEFPSRYGGNIRVTIGKADKPSGASPPLMEETLLREAGFFDEFAAMRSFVGSWRREKKAEIKDLVKDGGPLVGKAFPGRAAILVALLELSDSEIECVYEKPGSLKIGHYLPGTRIAIRSDEELFDRFDSIDTILNLAWHIPAEIESYLRNAGYQGRIVQVV
jgi:SAM-dependent methyltransferase